ncbi:MAG: hypothetical protein ABEJ48_06320 [Halobacteriales archaeon]
MDERTVGQVEEWDSRPFEGGYDGLHSLADDGFTGAVTAAGAWLFMLNGRVIGVFNGRLDDFEHGSGTTYRAPHPSLPLLFTMLEQGGETQAQYFTDDTSIDEVDDTLTEANFTGYLELSENVLSGDYYVAYYGGRSLSAAFVGNSQQLITGDEAFQRAVDEVGIYEVIDVELEIHELPERSSTTAAASDTEETTPSEAGTSDDTTTDTPPDNETVADTPADPASSTTAADNAESSDAVDPEPTAASGDAIDEAEPEPEPQPEPQPEAEPEPADRTDEHADATDPSADSQASSSTDDPDPEPSTQRSDRAQGAGASGTSTAASGSATDHERREPSSTQQSGDQRSQPAQPDDTARQPSEGDAPEDGESPFSEEEQWRETRDVPALDPSESEPTNDSAAEPSGTSQPQQPAQNQPSDPAPSGAGTSEPNRAQADTTPEESQDTASSTSSSQAQASEDSGPIRADNAEKIRTLRTQLEERTTELESLREDLASTREERDQLREERDRLKQRIQTLESELEEARAQATDADPTASGMDPEEALTQTDIFIRYGSKGNATLEKAHQGEANKEEVTANLKLEHHTRFDAESVTVDGQPFDQFLQGTMEYQFTKWVVEDLLFELQETGSHGKLQDLYDVLPRFDRSELRGTVELRNDEGEEIHETFDIVVRDRMGQPLIVVNINDSRDPATSEMMEELIEAANNVKLANDTLGAAVEVTASFFKPDALETASEATSSGLLSRDRRASFIKMNRKQGYHLCLVEARNGAFHVNVPEL